MATEKRYGSIEEIKREFFPKLYEREVREAEERERCRIGRGEVLDLEELQRRIKGRRPYVLPDLEVRPQPVIGKLNNVPTLVTDEDRRQAHSFLDAKGKGLRDGG